MLHAASEGMKCMCVTFSVQEQTYLSDQDQKAGRH